MKTALITTTINLPTVLSVYRQFGPDVRFFVAMDKKTPSAAFELCNGMENCEALSEHGHYWKCSDLLGWNTIARRNIALLEALKWGADIIVSIDDDNLCLDKAYFHNFTSVLRNTFTGIQATSPTNWFDVGTLLDPVAPHRGFPHARKADPAFAGVVGSRVGVAAGICLGDPDIGAVDRISRAPIVHRVSELLRAGIVVDPVTTRTVFNSQNTAIIRDLAPAFFMVPSWGRYDDIFASLLVQRVMRERELVVHFGQPFVWQQRNAHDLLKDLAQEQWGAEHILKFTAWLDGFTLSPNMQAVDAMKILFSNLPDWMPDRGKLEQLVLAWCEDVEGVMK